MIKTSKCRIQKRKTDYRIDLAYRYHCNGDGTLADYKKIPKLDPLAPAGPVDPNADPDPVAIAIEHNITQNEFEDMVGEFFFPNQIPFPEIRTTDEMNALILQALGTENNPTSKKIQFEYDEFDDDSNVMLITVPAPLTTVYSAYLFKGVIKLFQTVAFFHFYKAIDDKGLTVAIAAVDGGGKVLYLGELAGLFP